MKLLRIFYIMIWESKKKFRIWVLACLNLYFIIFIFYFISFTYVFTSQKLLDAMDIQLKPISFYPKTATSANTTEYHMEKLQKRWKIHTQFCYIMGSSARRLIGLWMDRISHSVNIFTMNKISETTIMIRLFYDEKKIIIL